MMKYELGYHEMELDCHGMRAHEAVEAVDAFLDKAYAMGIGSVSIVYGYGQGILRSVILDYLKRSRYVEDYSPGVRAELIVTRK